VNDCKVYVSSDLLKKYMASSLSTLCTGLQQAYDEPVSSEEMSDDQDGKVKFNIAESWNNLTKATSKSVLDAVSKGVSNNMYMAYI